MSRLFYQSKWWVLRIGWATGGLRWMVFLLMKRILTVEVLPLFIFKFSSHSSFSDWQKPLARMKNGQPRISRKRTSQLMSTTNYFGAHYWFLHRHVPHTCFQQDIMLPISWKDLLGYCDKSSFTHKSAGTSHYEQCTWAACSSYSSLLLSQYSKWCLKSLFLQSGSLYLIYSMLWLITFGLWKSC